MDSQIHDFILASLAAETSEDDIIFEVCEKAGVDWETARGMVQDVNLYHDDDIKVRQFPVKGLLSIVFGILGLILIIQPAVHLWVVLGVTESLAKALSGRGGVDLEMLFTIFRERCALMSWVELPSIIFTMMAGAAIIVANIKYLRDSWTELWVARN